MIIAGRKKQTNKPTKKNNNNNNNDRKTGKLNNRGFKNFLEMLP